MYTLCLFNVLFCLFVCFFLPGGYQRSIIRTLLWRCLLLHHCIIWISLVFQLQVFSLSCHPVVLLPSFSSMSKSYIGLLWLTQIRPCTKERKSLSQFLCDALKVKRLCKIPKSFLFHFRSFVKIRDFFSRKLKAAKYIWLNR